MRIDQSLIETFKIFAGLYKENEAKEYIKKLRKLKNKNWNELWEETMKYLKTP